MNRWKGRRILILRQHQGKVYDDDNLKSGDDNPKYSDYDNEKGMGKDASVDGDLVDDIYIIANLQYECVVTYYVS